jgi:hypothetical protein
MKVLKEYIINLSSLPVAIIKLETSGLALTESINIVATIKNIIKKLPSQIGKNVNLKFNNVLNKNKGFNQIKIICQILEEEDINPKILFQRLNP